MGVEVRSSDAAQDGGLSGAKLPSWLRLLPVIAALAVAAVQVYRAQVIGLLSADRGGGFGMFATVDKANNRVLRAIVIHPDGRELPITPSPALRIPALDVYRAHAHPTPARLRLIARRIVEQAAGRPIAAVRIEVWTLAFDGETGVVRRTMLTDHTLKAGGG